MDNDLKFPPLFNVCFFAFYLCLKNVDKVFNDLVYGHCREFMTCFNLLINVALLITNHYYQLAQLNEWHRRDGFEVGNADKIFESTYQEQLTRKTAD